MSNDQASGSGNGISPNAYRLLWAGFTSILTAGVGFSIRNSLLDDWGTQFGFTQTELGIITGSGLTGFGLTIVFFSFFADRVGYGPLMAIAFLLHVASAIITLAATPVFNALGRDAAGNCLYWGTFLFSLANGTCEAVVNPLTASLFPKQRTHWLNILHAGWPGGLILGALLGVIFNTISSNIINVRWEIQISMYLIPALIYGLMMFRQPFPHSEARKHGVTIGRMMEEIGLLGAAVFIALIGLWLSADVFPAIGIPYWLGWFAAVALLAAYGFGTRFSAGHWMIAFLLILHGMVGYVELGTDSWIQNVTGTILKEERFGQMLFVWTSALMFGLRFFAGPIVHKISPLGLLFGAASIAMIGLYLLGNATTGILCVLAATIYGIGKTYYWPTMLGVASERFPKGGALLLGSIGGVGMLSAGLLGGTGIGYKQDYFATNYLKENASSTYERYKADREKSFLFFPKIAGLDQAKTGTLVDGGKKLQGEIDILSKTGRKLSEFPDLEKLSSWWSAAKAEAEKDKAPVTDATLHGGKMALKWTALVPLMMAIGYLLLIAYFRAIGGYKQVHIEGAGTAAREVD
ncbi:MAG: MFS transporter [Planctomycetes bacterium]|nr:MFS transporter [Planctomycetota bacterium]